MSKLIEAWDKNTGEKLGYLVPEHWFEPGCDLAGHLSKLPVLETPPAAGGKKIELKKEGKHA